MIKDIYLPKDLDGEPVSVMQLQDSQDVDGTSASTQSTAIDGHIVRIVSLDNLLRVAVGANPVAGVAGIAIPALGELWLPVQPGWKVAVRDGKANITTAGTDLI